MKFKVLCYSTVSYCKLFSQLCYNNDWKWRRLIFANIIVHHDQWEILFSIFVIQVYKLINPWISFIIFYNDTCRPCLNTVKLVKSSNIKWYWWILMFYWSRKVMWLYLGLPPSKNRRKTWLYHILVKVK